jgi:aminoglycoside phosphotransferase/GNAT superfamily N-acetyltransferase
MMNLTIKPLTPDLTPAYLDFFDNKAFSDGNPNGPCYCASPNMDIAAEQQMVSEFGNGVKETVRRYAVQMLSEQKIHGYLAFDGDMPIGWCNAGDRDSYVHWIPKCARQNFNGKTVSVACLCIAPEYRGKGVSTALLERVIVDAKANGYAAVEGYAKVLKERDDYDFTGPARLFEKAGFVPVAKYEDNGVRVVMRKTLHDQIPLPDELSMRLLGFTCIKDHIGCSSAGVFRYERENEILYLKIAAADDEIRHEHDILNWLKGKLPVPEVLHYCERSDKAFLLMTAVDGFMACDCPEDVVHAPIPQTVKLLADGLLMLQAVDTCDCPFINTLDYKLKAALYNIEHDLVDMDGFEDGNDFDTPMALYQWLCENRPTEDLAFTHGDYCLPNIFINDSEVTGFIDMGRGGIADKWQDIALCVRSLGYNLRHAEQQEYIDLLFSHLGIKPDEEKNRYYILLDELF